MNYREDLAVQSFCYRGIEENEKVAEAVQACGIGGIELCGRHVDFGDESSFEKVIGTYRKAGIKIVSIGVARFNDDEASERKLFEFAKGAGCTTISADFIMDAVPGVVKFPAE